MGAADMVEAVGMGAADMAEAVTAEGMAAASAAVIMAATRAATVFLVGTVTREVTADIATPAEVFPAAAAACRAAATTSLAVRA